MRSVIVLIHSFAAITAIVSILATPLLTLKLPDSSHKIQSWLQALPLFVLTFTGILLSLAGSSPLKSCLQLFAIILTLSLLGKLANVAVAKWRQSTL